MQGRDDDSSKIEEKSSNLINKAKDGDLTDDVETKTMLQSLFGSLIKEYLPDTGMFQKRFPDSIVSPGFFLFFRSLDHVDMYLSIIVKFLRYR